jgi:hypothetical protein
MERFGRIMQDLLRVSYAVSVMAVEWLIGVILMVATVVGSAAAAVSAPNLDISSGYDAGPEQRAARSVSSSRSIADRRVRKKMFRICAYLTVMWCALWTFVFSYGTPAGGQATVLQVIAIPPAVLLVLIIGLGWAITGRLNSALRHPSERAVGPTSGQFGSSDE